MPVITVGAERLNALLGMALPLERLVEALEDLGCDVEDTATAVHYRCPACEMVTEKLAQEAPPRRCDVCELEQASALPEVGRHGVVRLDLLADRPDLFDAVGLARALRGTLGREAGLPAYEVEPGDLEVEVDERLSRPASYRPFIACGEAVLPPLDGEVLRELMRLQENLHWGIGRDRKLCSIGVYDLGAIRPPIRYTLIEPDGQKFVPLGYGKQALGAREVLEAHPKGCAYAHLVAGMSAYPLLIDSRGQVLSMPPIINSEETRLRLGTQHLFIDVTGIAEAPVRNALATLATSLIELGGRVRAVTVAGPAGERRRGPDLAPRRRSVDLDLARRWLGLGLGDGEFVALFGKMRLGVVGVAREAGASRVAVDVPVYRTDVRHEVDLIADLAIAYGYGAMPAALVPPLHGGAAHRARGPCHTASEARPEERLSAVVRQAMLGLGYWETMSLVQTSVAKHFRAFRLEAAEGHAVIANPKTVENTVVRCHLMTGLLETLARNRRKAVPQRFFELGNVVLMAAATETGTREERRLALAEIGPEAGYAGVRAATDALCRELGVVPTYRAEENPTFVPGRCAGFEARGGPDRRIAGRLGELHPEVLEAFGLGYPVGLAEITLCRVV